MNYTNMTIDELNEQAQNLLKIATEILGGLTTDTSKRVDIVAETETQRREAEKQELLQKDLNLADLIKQAEQLHEDICAKRKHLCEELDEVDNDLASSKARLEDLRAQREAVHKEWCEKFANDAMVVQKSADVTEFNLAALCRKFVKRVLGEHVEISSLTKRQWTRIYTKFYALIMNTVHYSDIFDVGELWFKDEILNINLWTEAERQFLANKGL